MNSVHPELCDSFLQSITDVAGRKTSFGYTSIGGYKQLTAVTFPDGQKAMYSYDNAGSMLKAYDEEAKGGVGFAYAKFNGTVCVQKVREFAATSLTAAETVGSRWHLWVFGPKMKEYRFYGPDQTSDTATTPWSGIPSTTPAKRSTLSTSTPTAPKFWGYPPPPTPQTPRPRRKTASPVRRLPAIWPKTS